MQAIARLVVTLALVISSLKVLIHADGATAAAPKINGWFPCDKSAAAAQDTMAPTMPLFECAEVTVPLCYEDICTSAKTIDLFVKRLLGLGPTASARKAMWLLQGGPGFASSGMEGFMLTFNRTMGGKVDLYTLDHRGTGRSNYLECQAAQAFAAGSPNGVNIDLAEIPNCIEDLLFQMDNHTEAFSVTSAAKDVELLVDLLNGKNSEVFVYGASYGTLLTSRVMHLAPKHVKGYIIDGVIAETSDGFTSWNANRRYPDARFVKLCESDTFCSSKLSKEINEHGNLAGALRALYKRLDDDTSKRNECSNLMHKMSYEEEKPSQTLRNKLGWMIQDTWDRIIVPAILHRVYNCGPKDVAFLKNYFDETKEPTASTITAPAPTLDLVDSDSRFLSSLIVASEMWATPSPSWADEVKSFNQGLFSTSMAARFDDTCFFRANFSDPVCHHASEMNPKMDFAKLKTKPFVYKPDKYSKKYATIPSHASVMVITGGLDFQTVQEEGTKQYEGMRGSEKILVNFETGGHCAGISRQTSSDRSDCGYKIISSFVFESGSIAKVNTSCMSALPALDFADLAAIRAKTKVTSIHELYDSK